MKLKASLRTPVLRFSHFEHHREILCLLGEGTKPVGIHLDRNLGMAPLTPCCGALAGQHAYRLLGSLAAQFDPTPRTPYLMCLHCHKFLSEFEQILITPEEWYEEAQAMGKLERILQASRAPYFDLALAVPTIYEAIDSYREWSLGNQRWGQVSSLWQFTYWLRGEAQRRLQVIP